MCRRLGWVENVIFWSVYFKTSGIHLLINCVCGIASIAMTSESVLTTAADLSTREDLLAVSSDQEAAKYAH